MLLSRMETLLVLAVSLPLLLTSSACAQSALGKLPEAEVSFRLALLAGSKDGRFGDAAHWIGESKTDEQLAELRARPAYARIVKEFAAAPAR